MLVFNMLKTKQACELLGIHPNTLRKWADNGKIKYIRQKNGNRLFDIEPFINPEESEEKEKTKFIYARVSTRKQKDDLSNQVKYLRERYPTHNFIEDYGSGLNFKRKGFQRLLGEVLLGRVSEIVITHRDRLCRFGFEMFRFVAEQFNTKIVVLDQSTPSPKEELVQDLISIIHVFSCRIYGLRKYSDKIQKDQDIPK